MKQFEINDIAELKDENKKNVEYLLSSSRARQTVILSELVSGNNIPVIGEIRLTKVLLDKESLEPGVVNVYVDGFKYNRQLKTEQTLVAPLLKTGKGDADYTLLFRDLSEINIHKLDDKKTHHENFEKFFVDGHECYVLRG